MNDTANESLIRCKNCEGYYEASLTECPYCHVSTEENLAEAPAAAAAPSIADYAGGFGEPGSVISRVAAGIAIVLLLISVAALLFLGTRFVSQFAGGKPDPAPESSASASVDPADTAEGSTSAEASAEASVPEEIVLTSITLDTDNITLAEGEVYQLVPTVWPNDWEGELTWSSDNKKVASVDEDGKLTNVNGGDCIITVTAGEVSTTCQVHCEGLTAEEKKAKKEEEKRKKEEAKRKAEEEKKKKAEEEAKRKAEEEAKRKAEEEKKKMEEAATAGGLKLTLGGKVYAGNDFTLSHVGEGYSFEVSGGDGSYKWSSSNTSVATVSGGKVTATGVGTANITCTSGDGKSVTAIIRVSAN